MTAATDTLARTGESGFPPFRARPPWLGGDLQTLRNVLFARPAELAPWPARRLELALGDGDRLAVALHAPAAEAGRPLAVLIHGLTGCEDSSYIRSSARHLLGLGHPVLRLNLRGAGPSRTLCRRQYNAGSSADLRDALSALRGIDRALLDRGLLLVGYSLGANMLLKFLAEYGAGFPVVAGVAVSAPIDLKATQMRLMAGRNAVYHRYLLTRMRRDALAGPAEMSPAERRAVSDARTIYDFDDRFVAPRGGYAGADDYYARCGAQRFLAAIEAPTLVIHARDDPWIPAAPYAAFDWPARPNLVALLPASGGHVGFHGRDSEIPWYDRCMARFFTELIGRRWR